MMNKKHRSPNQVGETNTMDSFQDGGQQNMNSAQNDFMDSSHMNADMNNYPPSSIGMEGYGRMNQNVHPSQMQGYSPYNRENFNPGEQHGGATGSSDYMNQNASFQGQYPRQGMPMGMKPGMRAGMGNQGAPMMPPYQQRMSGQSISQQSGPTPTLNQLLQTQSTSSTSQRMQPNNYSEYSQKGMNDMNNPSAYNMQQPWGGHPRPMGYSHPGSMNSPGPGFRGQNMSDMNQPRPGFAPSNYQMPPQSQYGAGQYSPNSRYGNMGAPNRPGPANMPNAGFGHPNPQQMSSGQPPGMTPPPSGGMASPMPNDSPHHRQASPSPSRRQPTPSSRSSSPLNTTGGGPQQQQPSPSGSTSSWSGATANGNKKSTEEGEMDISGCDDVTSCDTNSQGLPTSNSPHPSSISSLRPVPSPVGSSGSRSNTPASLPGNQAGSPMPPRPPSQHESNPSSRMTQSPMATSYNPQMMPPPMGPNQGSYGPSGGKMSGNMPGPMNQGYPQYNSHYPQGNYSGRPGMSPGGGGMQNYPMYNGPNPGAPSGGAQNMYNNMPMNRNSNYNPYGGQSNMMSGMNNYNAGINDMANGPRPPTPGTPGSGASTSKSAKAAAQAALMAAANQQRPSGRSNIPPSQMMYGQGGPHPGFPAGMTNSHSPVPNSIGPNSNMPNSSSAPNMADSNSTHNSLPPLQEGSNSQSNGPPSNSFGSPSSVSSTNEKMPSQQNIPPSKKQSMQRDSNLSSGSNDNVTSSSEMTANVGNDNSVPPPQSSSMDSKEPRSGTPPSQGLPPESLGADSNMSSLTDTSSQGGDMQCNDQKEMDMPSIPDQTNLPSNAMKQELPITTTATTNPIDKNIVTQVNTCPVMSTTEVSSDGHGHIPTNLPPQQPPPPNPMPPLEEAVPDKKKKEGVSSHPPTPASLVAPSPGSASVSSFHEDFDNITSPPVTTSNWANQSKGGDVNKLYEMGSEPERRYFLNRLLSFLEERSAPLNNMPSISKQPLDLYRLYLHVQERGGMLEVTKAKKWKEICGLINIGSSASAAFTLKKNYIKYLFHYECQFERGGMDPGPILANMEAQLAQKRESKRNRAPSPGKKEKAGSQGSQDAFRPPSNSNANQGMEGFPGNMPNQGYDPNMGPMGMPGMMPQGQMMNNMMPPSSMGGMGHNQMMHPGMMGNNYNMRPGMMNPNMMPHNNMMGMPQGGNMGMSQNNMGMPGSNMGMQTGGMRMSHGNNMGMPNTTMGPGMHSGNNMGMPPQNNMGMGHGNSMGMPPQNSMGMPPQNNMNMTPGNNMGMPPSGNHMPMPPSRGNIPPSTTNQVVPPVNGDSISCQDPFADDMNNSAYMNSGQPNSQGSNFPGMPPHSNAGSFNNNSNNFNKPNMPPNSMAPNVPSSSMGQTSTQMNSSIPSQNSMGPNMMPSNMGPSAPPTSMSPMMSGAGAAPVPPSSMGQPMPPSSMSQSMPPSSMSQPMPPSSMSQPMPPSSSGQPLPPSSMGPSGPPSSTGPSMPLNNMGQQVPPNSMGQPMPPNSMGQPIQASSMDQIMTTTSVPQTSVSPSVVNQNMSQTLPSNMPHSMPPSSQTFNNMNQCGPPSSMGQNMPPISSSQNMPNFQPTVENSVSNFSQDSSIPFSNYQGNNSQDGDLSQGSASNMSTPSLSSGRNFPFGENHFSKPERFDSPNPVQSVTPTPTPPPQRQPTPQSSTPLQQQVPAPQDSTFPTNRYGNQPPTMMPQGHMSGPPHDPYGHQNFPPHQQGYSTPNKMMGGGPPPDQYAGYPPQYQNYPNQRPPMMNDMNRGMYNTPNKRFPDQYPNQAGYNSQSGYGSQPSSTQSYSSSGMMGYNTPPSSYADGSHQTSYMGYNNNQTTSYGDVPHPSYHRDSMGFESQDSRPNNQWSQMPRYGHGGHGLGMSPAPNLPPHMASSPYQRGHRMSPTPMHKTGSYASPPKMMQKMHPNQIPKKEIPFPPDSVEATTPNYFKRRRLTRADVGPIEAWRVMMGLKSGLLAESTWALDTLNILLYDDATVQYFNLAHLPGLLEALLEHFRKSLISIFGDMFEEMEKMSDEADEIPSKNMLNVNMEDKVAITEEEFTNYTYVSRKGVEVKMEDNEGKGSSPLDRKEWDIYSGYSYKYGHWQLGGGDLSSHIVPCYGNSNEGSVYRRLFFRPPKEEVKISEEKSSEETENNEKSKDLKSEETIQELNDSVEMKEEEPIKNHVINKVKIKEEPVEEEEKQKDIKEENCEDANNKEINGCDNSVEETADIKLEKVKTESDSDNSLIKHENDSELSVLEKAGSKRKLEVEMEDEAYQKDEPPLRLVTDMQEELGRRCVCISNIFRSLSSIPSNHLELSKHPGLMYTLGKLLMLNHRHLPRNTTRRKFDRDDSELEDISDGHLTQCDEEWWWEYFSMLRENTLVIFANICGHLELKYYPEEICMPILDGLLHWAVCPSSCATDPLPSTTTSSVLSPQRLVLEALSKLCIHETNVDLLLATPPFDRIVQLFSILTKLLANKSEPVTLEFALVLLSSLVQGDSSCARAVAMQHPSISLLLDFLETAEHKAMTVANHHGINALRDNPEIMGTSLDMLRRAANILHNLALVPENRSLFTQHQQRLLSLVMSQILDQFVAQILSDVLYLCFQGELPNS